MATHKKGNWTTKRGVTPGGRGYEITKNSKTGVTTTHVADKVKTIPNDRRPGNESHLKMTTKVSSPRNRTGKKYQTNIRHDDDSADISMKRVKKGPTKSSKTPMKATRADRTVAHVRRAVWDLTK